MVLASVVGSSRSDITWITRTMGRVFPEQWERFRDAVPPDDREGDLAGAYARLLQDPDPAVHEPAAVAWCEWEDTHVATVPGRTHDPRYDDPRFRLSFSRLVTHYWSNGCFVADHQVLRDADRLAGIPIVMVNGQLDISGPLDNAWHLAKVLPDAELVVISEEGHGASGTSLDVIVAATNRFAA
jgi:proline iminopeptidase